MVRGTYGEQGSDSEIDARGNYRTKVRKFQSVGGGGKKFQIGESLFLDREDLS